jgi:hypothetical protein
MSELDELNHCRQPAGGAPVRIADCGRARQGARLFETAAGTSSRSCTPRSIRRNSVAVSAGCSSAKHSTMHDAVIDPIAELPGVLDTESKVARWID